MKNKSAVIKARIEYRLSPRRRKNTMLSATRKQTMVGHFALVACALTALLVWWQHDRPISLNRLADAEAIAAKFEETVFGNDFAPDTTHLRRWRSKIDLFPATTLSEDLRAALREYATILTGLTGLEIIVVNVRSPANSELHVAPESRFRAIIDDFRRKKNSDAQWTDHTRCYMTADMRNWQYERALFVVGATLPPPHAKSCLLEELYQGLGPGKNTSRLRYSISYAADNLTELSLNDKLILRALYDDRLAPGMPRAEAMKIARQVIAELHAAVRARGPDALIHPRHKARTAAGAVGAPRGPGDAARP